MALIVNKITYALPAFAGQLTADDRNRVNSISRKALRRGLNNAAFDIDALIDSFDRSSGNRGSWDKALLSK